MISERKLAEHYSIIGSPITLDMLVDMSVEAFKTFMRKRRKNYEFLNVRSKKHSRYLKHFVNMTDQVVQYLYMSVPEARFNKLQIVQVFLDYFDALASNYSERGLAMFHLTQIDTVYSMEVFTQWIDYQYNCAEDYIREIATVSAPKKQVEEQKEFAIDFRTKMKKSASGLDEFRFGDDE